MGVFDKLLFLGTSSGVPCKRNVSSILLTLQSGRCVMVDCGEGTQHQFMRSPIRLGRLNAILITHLHGDHCYGLFGLLHTLAMNGRVDPLPIIGPVGLKKMIHTVFELSGGWFGYDLMFTELDPLRQHTLEVPLGLTDVLSVTACPLKHVIPALGYVFLEAQRPCKLDMPKIKKLMLSGPILGKIKAGQDVAIPETGVVVKASDCLLDPPIRRRVAIVQDTCDPSAMAEAVLNVDYLVHECTYEAALRDKAIEHGHSTSAMAGEFARRVKAKNLVLTHFSPRYEELGVAGLVDEAKAVAGEDVRVIAAEDFLEVKIE
jgi:ribonuclease Z